MGTAGIDPDAMSSLPGETVVAMLDRLTDGVVVFDADYRIEYLNVPGATMLGRTRAELLGRELREEFPESVDHPFLGTLDEAVRTGEPRRFVDFYEPLRGWFESRIFPQGASILVIFRDITEEHQAGEQLQEYAERMAEAERIIRFGVWKWDVASGRVRWSDELHRIYGLRPGEFGGSIDDFIAQVREEDRERVWRNVSDALETHEPFVFEERVIRADGVERTLLSQGRAIVGADGTVTSLVGVCHDVTDRTRAEQALGASERRMRAIIDNTPSLITVKDLDGRYVMSNREARSIIGLESEELMGIHCVDVFPAEVAAEQRQADRRAASEGEAVFGETSLEREGEERSYVTVTFPLPDEEGFPVETCTIATDVTERKERDSERRHRLEWTERIASALDEDRLRVFAQPIVDLASGSPCASELLVRMRTPGDDGRIEQPATFLPAAERFGLVQSIDLWMVRQAVAMPTDRTFQVNLSGVTLSDPAARREITEVIAAADGSRPEIVFEITETASVVQLQAAKEFAAEIIDLGCRLALDDFGVGFGSFTYLRSLPLSYIKIDLSFVRDLTASADDRRVVKGINRMAHEFGLETIAEGVEDAETLELLGELGADQAQGYHLGRPAPLAQPWPSS
jgi:PAS domain S-box-containing protein